MRFGFIVVLGLVFAAGLGIAAHVIARDTVALPVASIEAGRGLAPTQTRTRAAAAKPRKRTRTRATATTAESAAPTVDDNRRGRGREGIEEAEVDSHSNGSSGSNSGSSGSNSGSSGSGRGGGEDD